MRSVRSSSAVRRSPAAPAQRRAAAVCVAIVRMTARGTRRSSDQRVSDFIFACSFSSSPGSNTKGGCALIAVPSLRSKEVASCLIAVGPVRFCAIAHCLTLFGICEEIRSGDTGPEGVAVCGKRVYLIGVEPEAEIAAIARRQPMRQRAGCAARERQHGAAPEGTVRLTQICVRIVAGDAEQHGWDAEGKRNVARGSLLRADEIHFLR